MKDIIDKISQTYNVLGSFQLTNTNAIELRNFLKDNYREAYKPNERLVVFLNDDNIEQMLLTLLDHLLGIDIGSYFVIVVSNNDNIEQSVISATSTGYDKQPLEIFKNNSLIKLDEVKHTNNDRLASLKLPNSTFCVLPWISLETSPVGGYKPCCNIFEEITDEDNNPLTVHNATIDECQNAFSMNKLREEFLQGKKPVACNRCWSEEDVGRNSKRINTLERMKDMGIRNIQWDNKPKNLMFVDLKLGNICNLKCRICGSYSSSTYATEELKQMPYEERKGSYPKIQLVNGAWPRNKELSFWDDLRNHTYNIRYLEFTGGEPFMIKQHFEFLQMLIDLHLAHQIEIHYNTNGTIYPKEAEHIWLHFKHVEIAFSIDAVGDKFEYQRTEANWEKVNENIIQFKKLREELNNISLQVCSTINIFNVMYLDEVAEWIDQQDFDYVHWNMLHTALQHCITSLTPEAKDVAYSRLVNSQSNHKEAFQRVADFMMNAEGVSAEELIADISKMDLRRGHNLASAHPELAVAIGYNG